MDAMSGGLVILSIVGMDIVALSAKLPATLPWGFVIIVS